MKIESGALPARRSGEDLSESFKKLTASPDTGPRVFNELETTLRESGYLLANEGEVTTLLNNPALVCRSENFSRVMTLLEEHTPLQIVNNHSKPNMCAMGLGAGFRIAMTEGFSGKEVGGAVKVVVVFNRDHLDTHARVPNEYDIWKTKPETAQVSLIGAGTISPEDIQMLSFRFPICIFPESLLTEPERERLEEENIYFIVRHYIPEKNRATH